MNEFEQLVNRMRIAQKNYFKTREKSLLNESKKLERQVDQHLDSFVNPKIDFDE